MKEKLSEKQNKLLETFAIIMLIIFALVSYFITNIINTNKSNNNTRNVNIYVNGARITEIDGEKIDINIDRVFTIGNKERFYNTIEIKDHKIRCIDSSCPDKICIKHSYLNDEIDNDMIVCAPNRLMIICE